MSETCYCVARNGALHEVGATPCIYRQGGSAVESEALSPNQYATYDEWDRAMSEHNREATGILHQFVGALQSHDEGGASQRHKARSWDRYAAMVREWDAKRPEWVHDSAPR